VDRAIVDRLLLSDDDELIELLGKELLPGGTGFGVDDLD
jgi:hypothetical protein